MKDNVAAFDPDLQNRLYAKRMARIFIGNQEAHYTADFKNFTLDAGRLLAGESIEAVLAKVGAA